MISLLCTFLCEYVYIDTNKHLSFIGIFERLHFQNVPGVMRTLDVVTRWDSDPLETTSHQVILIAPDGAILDKSPRNIFSTETGYAEGSHYTITSFTGLAFGMEGDYHIEILADDEIKETITLPVQFLK